MTLAGFVHENFFVDLRDAGLHVDFHHLRRGDAGRTKDLLAFAVQQREREPIEAALESPAAVPRSTLLPQTVAAVPATAPRLLP